MVNEVNRKFYFDPNFKYYKSLAEEEYSGFSNTQKFLVKLGFVLAAIWVFVPNFISTLNFKFALSAIELVEELGKQERGKVIHEEKQQNRFSEWKNK